MNNDPIKKFRIATRISSFPVAALTESPRAPFMLNISIIPKIHNVIPTAYMAIKLLNLRISIAKIIKIIPNT